MGAYFVAVPPRGLTSNNYTYLWLDGRFKSGNRARTHAFGGDPKVLPWRSAARPPCRSHAFAEGRGGSSGHGRAGKPCFAGALVPRAACRATPWTGSSGGCGGSGGWKEDPRRRVHRSGGQGFSRNVSGRVPSAEDFGCHPHGAEVIRSCGAWGSGGGCPRSGRGS